jgi:hypothetical protein
VTITVLKPLRGKLKPSPRTGAQAVSRVRSNPDTNQEASPFKTELAWVAQWRGSQWWVLGLFSSPWGTRFVVDASVIGGHVYAYVNYFLRPPLKWVRATAARWRLRTLYTRYTPAAAIQVAEKDTIYSDHYKVLGAAAKLAVDTAQKAGWYFVFYANDLTTGANVVLAVTSFVGGPVEEGMYASGYGFGSQPQLQSSIPLNLSDWVRALVRAHRWHPTNFA